MLLTASGKQTVKMPAGLRAQAKECWGAEVVVNVETTLSADGDVGETRALSIQRSGSADTAAADFEETFGALRDVWGTDQAKAYVENLRMQS